MTYHKRGLRFLNQIIIFMLVFSFFSPLQKLDAQTENNAVLSIVVPTGPYIVGQEITISVAVDTPTNTLGAQFGLTFNPAVLQCLHGDEGTFYSDWAAIHGVSTSVYPTPTCYNTGSRAGTVSDIAVFVLGASQIGGASGQGVIATYTFRILSEGYSALDFINTPEAATPDVPMLYDDGPGTSQKPIPLTLVPSGIQVGAISTSTYTPSITSTASSTPTITITPPVTNTVGVISDSCALADVNQDSVINVGDLVQIGSHWNESGAVPGWISEDVNLDQVISVGDLVVVGACWGGIITQPTVDTSTSTLTPTIINTLSLTPSTSSLTPTISSTHSLTPSSTTTSTLALSQTATLTSTPTLTKTDSGSIPSPTFTTGAQMRIEPDSQVVGVGQEFNVDILLNTTETARGAQTNVSWNPAVLQLISYEEGGYFSTWADAWNADEAHADDPVQIFSSPKFEVDNVNGYFKDDAPRAIALIGANSNGGNGPGANGVFMTLHFKSIAEGTAQLHLYKYAVFSFTMQTPTPQPIGGSTEPVQKPLTVTAVDGEVTVSNTVASAIPTNTLTPINTNTPTITQTPTKTLTPTKTNTVIPNSTSYISNTITPVPVPTIASASRVGFDPGQSMVSSVGSTFTVKVAINADKPVRGVSVEVKFNPAIIQCQSVDEGDFLSTWAASNGSSSMVFPAFKIDNTAGTIKDGAIILVGGPPTGGATGIASIINLNCKAISLGVSTLTITDAKLFDDGGSASKKYAVAYDSGEVFVGVTPTPTSLGAPTVTGGIDAYSATKTPTGGAGGAGAIGSPTSTPKGSSDSTLKTPGINLPEGVKEIIPLKGENPGEIIGSLKDLVDANGILLEDTILRSSDKLFAVIFSKDVQALTSDNYPLDEVTITCIDQALEEGSSFQMINTAYELSPSGSFFNPPITVMIAYDPNLLPKGVLPQDLSIGYFDTEKNQWVLLPSKLDKENATVSAYIEHFSTYALLANPPAVRWFYVAGGVGGFLLLLGIAVFTTLLLKKRAIAGVEIVQETIKLLPAGMTELIDDGSEENVEYFETTTTEPIQDAVIDKSESQDEEKNNFIDMKTNK